MKMIPLILSLCIMFSSVVWLPVHANDLNPIKLKMMVFEEIERIDHQGKKATQLIKPVNIIPNDTVVYITEYQNSGKQKANNVVITNPIPDNLVYIPDSATQNDALVTYSVDNGKKFNVANKLAVTDQEGKKRPAGPKDYTHVRWVIQSIAADSKGSVRFSAQLK